jgi:hypothetical protein
MRKDKRLIQKYNRMRKVFIEWKEVFDQMKSGKNPLIIPEHLLGVIPLDKNELHHELTLMYIDLEQIRESLRN